MQVRSNAEYQRAMHLIAQGLSNSEIARDVGVSRTTVRSWRRRLVPKHQIDPRDLCVRCGHPRHDPDELPHPSYAYLLGMYLGDGHISFSRIWRLRISLAMMWPSVARRDAVARLDEFVGPKN